MQSITKKIKTFFTYFSWVSDLCKNNFFIKKYTYVHVRTQFSVDPGKPPPPLTYTSSEPISIFLPFWRTNDYIWSAVFVEFCKLKTLFWAKKKRKKKKKKNA